MFIDSQEDCQSDHEPEHIVHVAWVTVESVQSLAQRCKLVLQIVDLDEKYINRFIMLRSTKRTWSCMKSEITN